MAFGGNGQWSRARNDERAKAFVRERKMEAEHREATRLRSQALWAAIGHRIRTKWRRIRH
jgi:hypothetical protein